MLRMPTSAAGRTSISIPPRNFSSIDVLLHSMLLFAWKAFRARSLAPPRMAAGTLSKETGDPSTCMTASPCWICTSFPPMCKGFLSTVLAMASVFLALRKRFFLLSFSSRMVSALTSQFRLWLHR